MARQKPSRFLAQSLCSSGLQGRCVTFGGNTLAPLDAEYLGKNQQFIKWQYVHDGRYPLIPPQEDKQGIFYGYTEVTLDREQDLWVWIGADDFASVWLNEHALWESDSFNWKFNGLVYDHNKTEWNNWNLTEYKRRVHFKKGINKFFFKLTNIQGGIFFSLILTK